MQPVDRVSVEPWMRAPETRAVLDALTGEGATARFVGGCVRDSLLGRPVTDIDIAIDRAPPDNLRQLEAAGIRTIPTGLEHGTVIAVVAGRHFEITSLRVDVETYGRHARVAYTDDWQQDAARRDFTMNALFADPDGSLYDPVGGLADLRASRVRFVGEARRRIQEDYLRILRFFRFHAWYGSGAPDAEALAACRALAAGIGNLSGERIRNELLRLLLAADPLPSLRLMADAGALAHVLPDGADLDGLARLIAVEPEADRLRRLTGLMRGDAAAAGRIARRFHLSRAERERLEFLRQPPAAPAAGDDDAALRRLAYRHGRDALSDLALLAGEHALSARILALRLPTFPLKGRDALALGMPAGPAVGALLGALEERWIDGGFVETEAELRAELARRVKAAGRAP